MVTDSALKWPVLKMDPDVVLHVAKLGKIFVADPASVHDVFPYCVLVPDFCLYNELLHHGFHQIVMPQLRRDVGPRGKQRIQRRCRGIEFRD